MRLKEDIEKIVSRNREIASKERQRGVQIYRERRIAENLFNKLKADIEKNRASMTALIQESRILELLQQAGRILQHAGQARSLDQNTAVSFYIEKLRKSTFLPAREIRPEGSLSWDEITKGNIITAKMHHADIRLILDYKSVSGLGRGSGGEDGPSYTSVPVGIGFYMDKRGNFYRPGTLNIFNRVATRTQWQRSSDPLERAIKNELNVYFQQPR